MLPYPGRPLVRRDLSIVVLRQDEEAVTPVIQPFVALFRHGVGTENQAKRGKKSAISITVDFFEQH